MPDDMDWFDEVAFPALMRAARNTYRAALREAHSTEFDDMPANGSYIIGGLVRTAAPLGQLIQELGVSKQAAGQLVDTLVLRGYLERRTDPEDRRRITVTLTERGRAAAAVTRAAVEEIDRQLVERVGSEFVAHTRRTLAALAHLRK